MKMSASATAMVAALLAAVAEAHGNSRQWQVGSSGALAGPMGQGGFREGIRRGDSGIPGPQLSSSSDAFNVLENTRNNSVTGAWYTRNPAAHHDNPNIWPTIPCMTNDSYGRRGVREVQTGDEIAVNQYLWADHGGFYRFELASGINPSNADFVANPISPFYSLHESAETSVPYPGRLVGWGKSDTDRYINSMNVSPGAGLGGNRKGGAQNDCGRNYSQCYFDDSITIPSDAPSGPAVLRWVWYSLETPQVYANCVDIEIYGNSAPVPPSPSPPTEDIGLWEVGCSNWQDIRISNSMVSGHAQCAQQCSNNSACVAYNLGRDGTQFANECSLLRDGCVLQRDLEWNLFVQQGTALKK